MEVRLNKSFRPGLVLWTLLLLALWATMARGSDLQRGITFQDGQRLTASELHQLIDSATITTGFLLNKPSATTLESGASLLVYSPAAQAFDKISAGTLLYNNTDLVTTQPEKGSPATNDFLLLYDSTGLSLAKVQLINLFSNSVATLPTVVASNLSLFATLHVLTGGSNASVSLTNLFLTFPYTALFTNLPVRLHPTNFDELLVAASDDNTNYAMRQVSLAGILTNLPLVTFATNTDSLMIFCTATNAANTNGATPFVARINPQNLGPRTFVFTNLLVTNTYILNTNFSYEGILPEVRAVLVVTNGGGEAGVYNVGDEIPANRFVNGGNNAAFCFGASATNVWFSGNFATGTADLLIPPRAGQNANTIFGASHTNFSAKVYVTYFPNQP